VTDGVTVGSVEGPTLAEVVATGVGKGESEGRGVETPLALGKLLGSPEGKPLGNPEGKGRGLSLEISANCSGVQAVKPPKLRQSADKRDKRTSEREDITIFSLGWYGTLFRSDEIFPLVYNS